jgi:5-methylcytosine-specific restriction protein A
MQNISYVYSVLGREWLSGLKPAKHVGTQMAAQIDSLIAEVEGRVLLPRVRFETQVRELQQKPLTRPAGAKNPPCTVVSASQYNRDPTVKAWVLKEANGNCEGCWPPAPFVGVDGSPYLEIHHVHHLADGGSDTPENAVALCPNCHRAVHYASNVKELVASLYAKVPRLVKE